MRDSRAAQQRAWQPRGVPGRTARRVPSVPATSCPLPPSSLQGSYRYSHKKAHNDNNNGEQWLSAPLRMNHPESRCVSTNARNQPRRRGHYSHPTEVDTEAQRSQWSSPPFPPPLPPAEPAQRLCPEPPHPLDRLTSKDMKCSEDKPCSSCRARMKRGMSQSPETPC